MGKKAQLQITDTDSFLFHCETDDVYKDMLLSMELFHTSDYPVGKMKDEVNGKPISEFVGLR